MSLTLTNIPGIMRSHGWYNGARLMDVWFSRPSAVAPAYSAADTTTIRMDTWVLTFPRAGRVYRQLMSDRVWANRAAQPVVARMLRRNGLLRGVAASFGNLNQPAQSLDRDYVNYRQVSFGLTDLDDMTAALGNLVFRVLVAGSVTPLRGQSRHQVTINQVGVYVRDSYDFNGNQFLGFWDDSDNSVSMVNLFSGTSVSNGDFRNWRSTNGRGGDFLVFSDIKKTTLASPDTFTV